VRKPSSLQDFFARHLGDFALYEIAISDDLKALLIDHGVPEEAAYVVVSIDEDNPCSALTGGKVLFRFNGRYAIPADVKDVKWEELLSGWFKEHAIKVEMTADESMVKFTAMVPVLFFDESLTAAEKTVAPDAEEKSAEPAPEEAPPAPEEAPPAPEEAAPVEPAETAPAEPSEKPAAPAEEEPATSLDEIEKELGL